MKTMKSYQKAEEICAEWTDEKHLALSLLDDLEDLARIIRAEERERCADLCEERAAKHRAAYREHGKSYMKAEKKEAEAIAEVIKRMTDG